MKNYSEANILIIISSLKKIISIFFGPFLTAYFIKVSADSLFDLSLYNIMNYILLSIGGIIVGWFIRNKFQLGMFRIGVISNFIYILSIVILKENILNFLPLISFFYGFSAITYYFPYNLFISSKINNKDRANYEFKKKIVSTLVSILTPLILGSIINSTNFELTSILILIISVLQIIFSFFIKPYENKNYKFTLKKSYQQLKNNKDIINMLKVDFFKGMNVSEGALEILITVLIFNAFKTNLNLGIFSSLSSIFIILMQFVYIKIFKGKKDKLVLVISSLIPTLCLIILLFLKNNFTITLYYFCYNTFVNVLGLILEVRLFNISNSKIIKENNQMEFWAIREVILNLGRILGYLLILLVVVFLSEKYLNYLMLIFTLSIIVMTYYGNKVGNYEDEI